MAVNYLLRLKLSNFLGSKVIEVENDEGVNEKGLFIPIEMNELYINERNDVYCHAFVNEKVSNTGDGASHYVKQKASKAHVAALAELGFQTPNLGLMRESRGYQAKYQKGGYFNNRGGQSRVKILDSYGEQDK